MPQFNDMFELSVEDVDLIEMALRTASASISHRPAEEDDANRAKRAETVRRIHDLLGRLHDQKIFYRPKDGVYVGG